MKKILLSLFLLGCYSLGFATITVQLDKSQVQEGETFRLILTLEGAQTNHLPDLTPLQKDFTIVGTQRSMNYSLVNGRAESINQWLILLTPKKTGKLVIPPIQIGQEKTTASTVDVTEQASSPSDSTDVDQQKAVMLRTEVSDENPYINQQVIYTVKLYSGSQRFVNASYQPPQVDDSLMIPLGEGRRYQTSENGQMYVVDEQQYAIFPQKSGNLNISPPSFRAVIYDDMPTQVNERAKQTVLNVQPVPAQFSGKNWLPAKHVSLNETFDNNESSLQQGSTIVRTVTLQAIGVPAQLLPSLDFGNNIEFSVYPEKPVERNTLQQPDLVGATTVKVTYLFNKAGQITIPELKLTWFNTTTGKEEIASLPAHTLQITGASSQQQIPSQAKPTAQETKTTPVAKATNNKEPLALTSSTNVAWWLVGGLLVVWLLTVALWLYSRRTHPKPQNNKQIAHRLKKACLQNDAPATRDALLQWARLQWPHANLLNLMDIEKIVEVDVLKQRIKELSQALYHHNTNGSWQGKELWDCVSVFKHDNKSINKDKRLPPIHKL